MQVNKTYTYVYEGLIRPGVVVLPRTRKFTVDIELEDRYKITFDDGQQDEVMKNSLVDRNAKEL